MQCSIVLRFLGVGCLACLLATLSVVIDLTLQVLGPYQEMMRATRLLVSPHHAQSVCTCISLPPLAYFSSRGGSKLGWRVLLPVALGSLQICVDSCGLFSANSNDTNDTKLHCPLHSVSVPESSLAETTTNRSTKSNPLHLAMLTQIAVLRVTVLLFLFVKHVASCKWILRIDWGPMCCAG